MIDPETQRRLRTIIERLYRLDVKVAKLEDHVEKLRGQMRVLAHKYDRRRVTTAGPARTGGR